MANSRYDEALRGLARDCCIDPELSECFTDGNQDGFESRFYAILARLLPVLEAAENVTKRFGQHHADDSGGDYYDLLCSVKALRSALDALRGQQEPAKGAE